MKYDNISRLLDKLTNDIDNFGYFYIETSKDKDVSSSGLERAERPVKKNVQKGIFRTNCMDCLDRTNVVQSVFARQVMLAWMSKVGIMNKGRTLTAFEKLPDNLEEMFRQQWTQNANAVSILYSGTPAMKTDFTATGKRTMQGAINDGYFGAKRFFLGNFYDSRDQDYIDFSLGKVRPKRNLVEKIQHSPVNALWILVFLVVLLFIQIILVGFFLGTIIDSYLHDHSVTIHWKTLASITGAGLVMFLAQKMKGMVIRNPIKKQDLC